MSDDEAIFETQLRRFSAPAPSAGFKERVLAACAAAPSVPVARPRPFLNGAIVFAGLLIGGSLALGPWLAFSGDAPVSKREVAGAPHRAETPKQPETPKQAETPKQPETHEPLPPPADACAYCVTLEKVMRQLSHDVHCPCWDKPKLCFFCGGILGRARCSTCEASKKGTCTECEAALAEARKTLGDSASDAALARFVLEKRLYCSDECQKSGTPCPTCQTLRKVLHATK